MSKSIRREGENVFRGNKRIAILGSGLSGLVTAYELNKAIEAEGLPFEFVLLEKRDRTGGTIRTVQTDEGPVDIGASSFDIRRDDIRPFLIELGLEDEIQYSTGGKLDRFSTNEFVTSKKPSYHGIPINFSDIMHEKELSLSDKLSVLINHSFNNMKLGMDSNTTTSEFLEYRFCKAVSTMIAYPNFPENIFGSMELCPPAFFDQNLINLFENTNSRYNLKEAELAHYMDGEGSEYTLKGGLAVLVETLMEKIPDVVLTGKKVTNLYGMDENVFLMTLNDNESLRAKTVISTLSIAESAPLLNNCEDIGIKIPQAQVSSMGTILYRFEKGALTRYPEGYGFVIPKRSSFHITKTSLLNRKWPSLKDADHDILLVEVGRRLEDTIVQLSDEAFLNIINEEVNEIFQVKGAYRSAKVYRWINNIPHLEANERNELNEITTIHKKRINDKGIFMGGNGFRGYGLPNAINEGKRLAREALAYMKAQQEL